MSQPPPPSTYNNMDGTLMLPTVSDLLTSAASSDDLPDFLSILTYPNSKLTVNSKDEHGVTSLMIAVFSANLVIARYILNSGECDVNAVDGKGYTVTHFAALGNSVNCIDFCLNECKMNINAQDLTGNTPLSISLQNNNLKSAEHLLDAGADADVKNKFGEGVREFVGLRNTEGLKLLAKYFTEIDTGDLGETFGAEDVIACEVCGVSEKQMFACSRCKSDSIRYCSKSCQIADWKAAHKRVCVKFAA